MCHNSGMQNNQIEKYIENGMPEKIVKTVKYTMKKRAEEYRKERAAAAAVANEELNSFHEDEPESMASSPSSLNNNNDDDSNGTTTTENIKEIINKPIANINDKAMDKPNLSIINKDNIKIPKLCGRFRQMQNQNNNNKRNIGRDSTKPENVYVDALAVGTQMTKQFAQRLNRAIDNLQRSKIYTLLTRTTQPAHVIAVCILSFVLVTLWPDIIDNSNAADDIKTAAAAVGGNVRDSIARKTNGLAIIAYLGAFATHFGAQLWMTFVSGLSLYFSLPRHIFGQCQQILFPKYFALNSILSISMLIIFVKYFLTIWNTSNFIQVASLTLTAIIEVVVRLYLAPPMLRLMHEKYKIEGAIGSGQEVGSLEQGDLVQCPHYQRIHKAFRRIHMTIAMGNMTVLLSTCLHLHFLASKIQIS